MEQKIKFFLSLLESPADKKFGFKFLSAENNNLSTEPCQLPVTATIFFLLVIAFTILKLFIIASVPELQNIELLNNYLVYFFILLAYFTA